MTPSPPSPSPDASESPEPSSNDLCAICGKRYGNHGSITSRCPTGEFMRGADTKFTPIPPPPVDAPALGAMVGEEVLSAVFDRCIPAEGCTTKGLHSEVIAIIQRHAAPLVAERDRLRAALEGLLSCVGEWEKNGFIVLRDKQDPDDTELTLVQQARAALAPVKGGQA